MARIWLTIITIILFIASILGGITVDFISGVAHVSGGGPHRPPNILTGIIIFNVILFVVYIALFLALGNKSKEDNREE